MSKNEESFEKLIAQISKATREKHLQEILKVSKPLKDVPLEIRKKEANQAIYLVRYE